MTQVYEDNFKVVSKYVHATSRGHEVIQTALGMQLKAQDYLFPYYRDDAMLLSIGMTPYELMLQVLAKKEDPFSGGRTYYCHPSLRDDDKPKIPHQSSATGMQAIPATGVAMGFWYQEAEKLLGRQSSEVGDLRNVVDSYINTQLNEQKPSQATETDEDIDFYSDPEKAMSRAIDNHPSVRAAEQSTRAYQQQTSMARLKEGHPDIQEIVADPKFAEWIHASNIRKKMFVAADQHFDVEAANELFSLWKDRSGAIKQTIQAEKDGRQKAVKDGSTGYTRGNPDSTTSKKIYRRADIIKLMKTDPERYLALSDDIQKAYAEKRVK